MIFTAAAIGGGMTLGSGGLAAPVGGLIMAHGMDHFFTGLQTAFSGNPRDNVTTQLLQKTGMPAQTAGLVDNGLSIAGSMGGLAAIRASQLAAFPKFRLPSRSSAPYRVTRLNKLVPHAEATGPHSSFKLNPQMNRISGYETYDYNLATGEWSAKVRFRGMGKPHGQVRAPFILERKIGKGVGSTPIVPRKPTALELPYGYE